MLRVRAEWLPRMDLFRYSGQHHDELYALLPRLAVPELSSLAND
jgi:hypothetical protein